MAIEHALLILSWMENLPKEDIPPEYLWDDAAGLDEWWQQVDARRNEESPAGGDEGMVDNELARELKRG